MISAEAMRDYLDVEDLRGLLRRIENGAATDAIGTALAEGLAKVRKEGEPVCFTLPETWRFATRLGAARARMRFLREHIGTGSVIVDASCGIGLMLRELARLEPAKLVGIEIDPVTAELARANVRLFGIEAEIRTLDTTSDTGERLIREADLVFCDPERVPNAKERTLDENTPSYAWLSERADRLAYEVSPRIPIDALAGGTIELYSERRRHARTTIYTGFDGPKRRVVSDRGEVLEGDPKPFASAPVGHGEELELLDPTVVNAGLAHRFGDWHETDGRYLRIGNELTSRPFIELFAIIARGTVSDLKAAAVVLDDFGRIIVRYPVEQDRYWHEANAIRKSSDGNRTFHVFKVDSELILAEQVP